MKVTKGQLRKLIRTELSKDGDQIDESWGKAAWEAGKKWLAPAAIGAAGYLMGKSGDSSGIKEIIAQWRATGDAESAMNAIAAAVEGEAEEQLDPMAQMPQDASELSSTTTG